MAELILDLILNFALQMLFTLGAIFLFGKVIALCNAKFYQNLGSNAHAICIATGFIGTPIHEASHALMCLLFGHKINEIKLFQPNSSDGTLGYVNHSYNPKNFYQKLGNLFIGIAPILVGSGILVGLLYALLPDMFNEVLAELKQIDLSSDLTSSLSHLLNAFASLFTYIDTWQWWVFLLIGSLIGLHMTLSDADLKGALSGIILFCLLFFVIDAILALVQRSLLASFTKAILSFGTFLLFFFCIFAMISAILLIVSFIVGKIKK